AGVVLGIGLAVDANVLINERIREETRKGRSAFAAIDTGFRRAYSTIIDGNMAASVVALSAEKLPEIWPEPPVIGSR
ncbi:MMPL family transporter, partial [Rhizobium ruizarguesonis]